MTRLGYAAATAVAVSTLVIGSVISPPVRLVWNASASTPVGLYVIAPASRLAVEDRVMIRPPAPIASFMAGRGYLALGVPLLKAIAALPGQEICRHGRSVAVDGAQRGEARDRDDHGRALPVWQGCRHVAANELFVMNPKIADSFDGRYFGALPASAVIGRAIPLWTDEDGDHRFQWYASTR